MFLIDHVTSSDIVRKGSCDFVTGTFSLLVPTLSGLLLIDKADEEIEWKVCHVKSCD